MALNEGQIITYMVDEVVNTIENNCPMAQRVGKYTPPAGDMQRSQNTIWMPVEQEAPTQKGWDLTDKETGILELSVKCNMGVPDNDFFGLRADDVRDETSLRRRIRASGLKLANNVETSIAKQAAETASLIVTDAEYVSAENKAWDMMSDAEALIFSRELNRSQGLSYFFNADDYKKAGLSLVGKDMYGRIPEEAYKSGTIQKQVAGFDDVIRSPKLPTLTAGTATGVTVDGAQKFKPEAWKEDVTDGNRENVDNRTAVVKVSDGSAFKRGDKISFAGVKFISQMAKDLLTQDATFAVVGVEGNNITIMPKPIALDDADLKPEQRAYANVNTSLANGAAINVLNVKTSKTNIFWADDSITLLSQPIPLNHALFSGMKTEAFNIPSVGLNGVVAYQGDISTLEGKCRIAVWYSACTKRPEAVGVGLTGQK
ncbi:TPA: coat protein [Proteus mirabilis]|nr:coat protein [Proteus mirabilis]